MKKQIAVILCLVMLISVLFSGCGAPSIVGTWEGSVDMTQVLNEEIAAGDESMAEYFNFEDITLDISLVFNEDGTCAMVFSEESFEAMMEKLMEQMLPALSAMMEELSGMSLDDMLALSGITEEEMMEGFMSEMMAGMDMSEMNLEANYKVENGKLYMSDSLDDEIDEDASCNPFTIEGDTLTIEKGENDDDVAFMFPLVLKKAG